MNNRDTPDTWIQTVSGRKFWPLNPKASDVYIEDIAHALSMTCRYSGHCSEFYSVAQHSVLMSRYIEAPYKLWALLHDASEAYIADIARPVKSHIVGYAGIEAGIMVAVCERFGLSVVQPQRVKDVDTSILLDERAQLMKTPPDDWHIAGGPLGIKINPWSQQDACFEFLQTFRDLIRGTGVKE